MLLKRNSQTIHDLNISFDGNKIKQEQNIRYLGFEIYENLLNLEYSCKEAQ